MPTSFTRLEKILAMLMMAASLLTLWAALAHPILDGDIWFHMLYGREMLAQKTLILDHTQFSWTPSTNDGIYCAWIGQLLYYFLYTFFAEPGIIAFRYLTCTVPFLALAHISWQRGVIFNILPWLAATITIFIQAVSSLDKPDLISLVLMTAVVWNWFQIRQCGPKVLYNIYLFPFVILLWVNSHGIFIFGCIFLLLIGIGETCNQLLYREQALPRRMYVHLIFSLVLSAAAISMTPYGIHYILQILHSHIAGTDKENFATVFAWKETFSLTTKWLYVFANFAVVLVTVVLLGALIRRRIDFVVVLVNVVFAYFFTAYARLVYLWAPVYALTVAYYAGVAWPAREGSKHNALVYTLCLFNCCAIGGVFYLLLYDPPMEHWPGFGESERFALKEEVDFIEQYYPDARLATLYNQGAYILWRRWPQQKAMMDARYFPYKNWYAEYYRFSGAQGVDAFLEKYPFDLAVISHESTGLNSWFARSPAWQPVFYGKGAVLYARAAGPREAEWKRGSSLNDIRSYGMATKVVNTALLLRDWQGYDTILAAMKKRFTSADQTSMIEGALLLKPAMLAYEQRNYPEAIELFEKANMLKAGYPPGMSASALGQSMLDWEQERYEDALRKGMRAVFAQESFSAVYNLAVMCWQFELLRERRPFSGLSLNSAEKEVLKQWRKALQQLVDQQNLPARYMDAQENARLILAGDKSARVFFLPEDWM